MINKSHLQSLINKYYLNGLIESVRWNIKDSKIKVSFISPSSDIVGLIEGSGFNIKDAEIAIYDTSRLIRLLNITSNELFVDLIKAGSIFTKLTIEDNQFNLIYSLANLDLVRKSPDVNEPEYNITLNLNSDDILALIKAKNALPDTEDLTFKLEESIVGDKQLEIIFGDNSDHSDRVSYTCKNVQTELSNVYNLIYNANIIKEILTCNKEIKSAIINISTEGLMRIEFEGEFIKSIYYLVQKENGEN